MGEVWRAVHQTQNVQGAVKFMTPKHARNPKIQSSFRGEVRAMARLDHPGIITIYDCGQVDDYVAHASNGYVVEGSSYLAMELASHTLLDLDKTRMDWQHARKILLSILDALAHSHARGVIHRDLKPANVLLVTSEQGTLLKLSDLALRTQPTTLRAAICSIRGFPARRVSWRPSKSWGVFVTRGPGRICTRSVAWPTG